MMDVWFKRNGVVWIIYPGTCDIGCNFDHSHNPLNHSMYAVVFSEGCLSYCKGGGGTVTGTSLSCVHTTVWGQVVTLHVQFNEIHIQKIMMDVYD